ncbi:hypothetical protein CIL03_08670 [Virgibacillus indicus]|uniref:Uncharacterized protein n=1 Tax=Virgibacillus indicus TaxID=2024554 RepID=A0A265NC83_9BACI|nr:hypothetical protein CIL03_08670 [Virgibacillus indicus]
MKSQDYFFKHKMCTVITISQYNLVELTDKFHNLRILHKDVHKLIHIKDTIKIDILKKSLGLTEPMLKKINKYREECELEQIK